MKINDVNKKSPLLDLAPGHAPAGKTADKPAASPAVSDNVSISAHSRVLTSQVNGNDMVFDASKVQAIKEAIAAGQFKVNPERIADGLINTAAELIRGRLN